MAAQPDFILDGLEDEFEPRVNGTRNFVVLFFHFAFRTAALVFYIVCGWMNNTFVTQSVLLLVLLALDFWFVKNVSGRILAGLRWWSAVDDGGNAFWVFESANRETSSVGAIQMPMGGLGAANGAAKGRFPLASTFWASLFGYAVVWCVFAIISFFTLSFGWLLLCLIAVVLNGSNVFGYVRCAYTNSDSRSFFGPMASAASSLRSAVVRRVAANALASAFKRSGDGERKSASKASSGYAYAPVNSDADDHSNEFVDFNKPGSSNVH